MDEYYARVNNGLTLTPSWRTTENRELGLVMVHLYPNVSRRLLLNGAVPGGRICLLEAELCTIQIQ